MTDIAAPVIEFVMPDLSKNLEITPETPETPESPNKPATRSSKKRETLTAELLNNEITKMRSIITTAKNRLISKSIRRKKDLESKGKKAEDEKKKEQLKRQAERLGEEIEQMKTIDRDTIAKFALLNTKSLEELKITGETPVNTRLLYKLATHEVVVKTVESYRQKYLDFNKSAAFFLQRLGLQYSHLKKEKEKEEEKKEKEEEKMEEEEDEEEKEDEAGSEEFDEDDVEMVDSDDEAEKEAAEKRRELLLGLIGVKEDKNRPNLKPRKRKIEEEPEPVNPKTAKKSAVKEEMQKVLEEQLKSVKSKKPAGKKPEPRKIAKKVEEPEEIIEDEEPVTTMIKKIDLSAGGKIAKKSKVLAKEEEPKDEKEESEDDDDDETPFFLPKNGVSKIADKPKEKEEKEKVEKNRGASKKKNPTATGEMHPSWAASQQKKREMQSAKPCGKKITFDD
ncbi:unnamed protein product [Caenorhabditis angaria]|uniref:Serum response factor-binding protein 1 n=1 Tax=Caenorhabditis angaria TaxID=860376 RepID=A0A9P1I5H4_9PELO|nr:unnamed protein product [Caenorhabditis angaria]